MQTSDLLSLPGGGFYIAIGCPNCGTKNTDWDQNCVGCKRELVAPGDARMMENRHIGYLLYQLIGAEQRATLPAVIIHQIRRIYVPRQKWLLDNIAALSQSSPPQASVAFPQAVQATGKPDMLNVPRVPPMPAMAVSAQQFPLQQSHASAQAAPKVISVKANSDPSPIIPFLQKNALKLLFALATLLILIAMKGLIAQTLGQFGVLLIPTVPIGLTAMFWWFGQKTFHENRWAAIIFHALTAAMLSFVVLSINRFWLHSAIPLDLTLMIACGASSIAAGAMLAKWREVPYLHIFQASLLLSIFTLLHLIREIFFHQSDFRATPLWLFGGVYIIIAAFNFLMARNSAQLVASSKEDANSAEPSTMGPALLNSWCAAWMLWANLSVSAIICLTVTNILLQDHPEASDFAFLLLFTGLIYATASQLLTNGKMAVTSAIMMVGGVCVWFSIHQGWIENSLGYVFLALGSMALALSEYNRRAGASAHSSNLASNWSAIAKIYIFLATLFAWSQTALLLTRQDIPFGSYNQLTSLILLFVTGSYYMLYAKLEKTPEYLYGAFATFGIALLNGLQMMKASQELFAFSLTLYGVILCFISYCITRSLNPDRKTNNSSIRGGREVESSNSSIRGGREVESSNSPIIGGRGESSFPLSISELAASGIGVLYGIGLSILDAPNAWKWTLPNLVIGMFVSGITAHRKQSPIIMYPALIISAFVIRVFLLSRTFPIHLINPQLLSLADSLGLFMIIAAAGALVLSLYQRVEPSVELQEGKSQDRAKTGEVQNRMDKWKLWQMPLTHMSLLALIIALIDNLLNFSRLSPSHLSISMLSELGTAIMLAAGRRESGKDIVRTLALIALNLAVVLEAAALCHLPGSAESLNTDHTTLFALSLLFCGAGFWIVGQLMPKCLKRDMWGRELATNGLVTVLLSIIAAIFCSYGQYLSAAYAIRIETVLIGGFANFSMEVYFSRKSRALTVTMIIFGGAASVNFGLISILPHVGLIWSIFALSATAIYMKLARRLNNDSLEWLALWPMTAGSAIFWALLYDRSLLINEAHILDGLWIVGGTAMVWAYIATALRSGRNEFTYASILISACVYLRLVHQVWHPHKEFYGLIMLAYLIVLYLSGVAAGTRLKEIIGEPIRWCALLLSGLSLLAIVYYGYALGVVEYSRSILDTVSLTLAAYGAAYTLMAFHRRVPWTVGLSASTLTAAYLHALLTHCSFWMKYNAFTPHWGFVGQPNLWEAYSRHMLSLASFAFLASNAAIVWLSVGWVLNSILKQPKLAQPLQILAGILAGVCAILAVFAEGSKADNVLSILTLFWMSAVWFGLWGIRREKGWMHVGIWNILAAWGMIIHYRTTYDLALWDIYILPVGLYMLMIGHLTSHDNKDIGAKIAWWTGLVMILLPAFLAFWQHQPEWHTVLLIMECVIAALWGVARKIRAYIYSSLGFLAALTASEFIGRLPGYVGTMVALIFGVGLFAVGFYVLTHRDRAQIWAGQFASKWRQWQTWR